VAVAVIWGVLVRLTVVACTLFFLWRVRYVAVTVIFATLLALIVNPVVDWLCARVGWPANRGTRRFVVTLAVFLVLIGLTVGLNLFLMIPFRHELSRLAETLNPERGPLRDTASSLQGWWKGLPPGVRAFVESQDLSLLAARMGETMRSVLVTLLEWMGHVVEIVVIPVLAYYFVLDSRPLKREFLYLVPRRRVKEAVLLLEESGMILQAYAVAQFILCAIAGVVVGVGLWLMAVPYYLTLGVLAGLTRAIPIVGPIIGGIPIVLITAIGSPARGLAVLIFFSLLHLVESKLIMPKLIGSHIHLHPALVLIVLMIGGEFLGILGMFLAAPLAAMLRVLYTFYVLRRPDLVGNRKPRVVAVGAPGSSLKL
jgi:predicted PurR-regulated permease PerM